MKQFCFRLEYNSRNAETHSEENNCLPDCEIWVVIVAVSSVQWTKDGLLSLDSDANKTTSKDITRCWTKQGKMIAWQIDEDISRFLLLQSLSFLMTTGVTSWGQIIKLLQTSTLKIDEKWDKIHLVLLLTKPLSQEHPSEQTDTFYEKWSTQAFTHRWCMRPQLK